MPSSYCIPLLRKNLNLRQKSIFEMFNRSPTKVLFENLEPEPDTCGSGSATQILMTDFFSTYPLSVAAKFRFDNYGNLERF
jgi:hypothetical protein